MAVEDAAYVVDVVVVVIVVAVHVDVVAVVAFALRAAEVVPIPAG